MVGEEPEFDLATATMTLEATAPTVQLDSDNRREEHRDCDLFLCCMLHWQQFLSVGLRLGTT